MACSPTWAARWRKPTKQGPSAMGPDELACDLLGGLNKRELVEALGERLTGLGVSLGLDLLVDDDFILPPLPNSLFTRDTSCWVYDGRLGLPNQGRQGAKSETVNYEAIYNFHPMFAGSGVHRLDRRRGHGAGPVIKGGDVEVIGNGTVLVGLGERTTPALALKSWLSSLSQAGSAQRVIAAQVPKARALMHLDTVMTMVDTDAFTLYSGLLYRGVLKSCNG